MDESGYCAIQAEKIYATKNHKYVNVYKFGKGPVLYCGMRNERDCNINTANF